MKYWNWKKVTVLLLLLALCAGLTGCSLSGTITHVKMMRAIKRIVKLQSFHTDAEIQTEILLNVGGQDLLMEATLIGGLDTLTQPLLIQTDLNLETLGVERELRYLLQKEGTSWYATSWDSTYRVQPEDEQLVKEKRKQTEMALKRLLKSSEPFDEPADDEVNGARAHRYVCVFPKNAVDEAMALLDLKPEGTDLPVRFWLSDDGRLVRAELDLAVFLQGFTDSLVSQILESKELEGVEMTADLKHADSRLTFSGFDTLTSAAA